MQAKADAQLLREYAFQGSEAAFGELVARYTDLIYSAVLRQISSPDLAEEIAQSVFTDLAHKAQALAGKLDENGTIVGWLYRSSRYALSKHLRAEQRRRLRENQAMQNLDFFPASSPDWDRLRPVLDKALAELNEEDRQAMLLRFFQHQDFQAVGAVLGVSEDTAQKRVARALEKLRAHLARQGITTAAAMLSTILSTHAVQPAPLGLAARLADVSIAGAAAQTGTALTLMTLTSSKIGIAATAIAAALALGLVEERRSGNRLQEENEALRQQINQPAQPPQLTPVTSNADSELEKLRREHAELLRLRGQLGVLRDRFEKKQNELAIAQSANSRMLSLSNALEKTDWEITRTDLNVLKYVGLACRVYAANHSGLLPTNFGQFQNQLAQYVEFPSGIGTNSFEFFDDAQPLSTNSPGYYFLARETQALQYPDGQWHLVYLLADGSVQIGASDDGNFATWEQQWLQRQAQEANQLSGAPSQ